jgi:hypothetical protein
MLKCFVADPDPGSGVFLTLDPRSGMNKLLSGINIPDPQHFLSRFKYFKMEAKDIIFYKLG